MRKSRIKAKLSRDEPVLSVQLHLTDPSLFEMASLMGFDAIWMDMEHHGYSLETAQNLMRAARVGGADVIARPAKGEFMRMGRFLESGAQAIMYPRCDNAAEAAEVVTWAKFPPFGRRGCDGAGADNPYCTMPTPEYLKHANDETFVIIQIEEPHALDQVEEIAKVDGVDLIFLGPGDYSIACGIPAQFDHPKILDATKRIAAAAKAAGKYWGQPAFSPQHAAELVKMGARLVAHGADLLFILEGLKKVQRDFASIGFSFDNRLYDA
jgi:4-hydroxy-2-oxoheptanedioate aldolase